MADVLKNNPKFQQRALNYFDQADKNKDGVLMMSEVLEYADTMQKLTGKPDAEIDELREALRDYYGKCGVTEEGIRRENWVDSVSKLAAEDFAKIKDNCKYESSFYKFNKCWFDALDLDEDGVLTKEEFANWGKCFDMVDANTAIFAMADTNKNGTLEWDEFFNLMIKFWFELEEDNLYQGHF